MTIQHADTLETRPCGRCGGAGRHSFNQTSGSRCFDCNGRKAVLTMRGKIASAFLDKLRSVPARDVAVGDLIQHEVIAASAMASTFSTVTEVRPSSLKTITNGVERRFPMIEILCTGRAGRTSLTVAPDKVMRKGFDAATKAGQFARAIAFQATLDERGMPRRNAA